MNQRDQDIEAMVRGIDSTPKAIKKLAVKVIETAVNDANRTVKNNGLAGLEECNAYRFLAGLNGSTSIAIWCQHCGIDPASLVEFMRTKFIDPEARKEFMRQWKTDSGRTENPYRPTIYDCKLLATTDPRRETA